MINDTSIIMNNDIRTFFRPPKSQQIAKTTLNTDDRLPDMSLPMKKLEALLGTLTPDELQICLEHEKKGKNRKCVCEYINKRLNPSTNCGLKNEGHVINRLNNDPEYMKIICENISLIYDDINDVKARKFSNKVDKPCYTPKFEEYKRGTKEVAVKAKTDIIIENVKTGQCKRLSLKTGKGRATSGDYNETTAIFRSTIEHNDKYKNDKSLYEQVNKALKLMRYPGDERGKHKSIYNKTDIKTLYEKDPNKLPPEDKKWYEATTEYHTEVNKIWDHIYKTNPQFVQDLISECLTGNYKYGDNSGSADCLMITKAKSTEIHKIFYPLDPTNPKFVEYCQNYIKSIKNPFASKSSRPRLWTRFL
jgi:hypothetical protein